MPSLVADLRTEVRAAEADIVVEAATTAEGVAAVVAEAREPLEATKR